MRGTKMNRCEDYPCCGHTDGLGCNYTPDYDYINKHIGCEHEHGWCYLDDRDEDEDEDWEEADPDLDPNAQHPVAVMSRGEFSPQW